MTDDFSLASPAGHLIMGDGSGLDGLATKEGAKALSRAVSVDTATTQLNTPSRTKNLITEYISIDIGLRRLFLWYHVRSLAVYIMNTGLTRRRRDDRTSSWQRITEGT